MITIRIKMASLVSDIKVKSHMNTDRIKDPSDKYAVRAGEENEAEIAQSLQDAWRAMLAICRRFLATSNDTIGTDLFNRNAAAEDQVLTFDVTIRRSSNLAASLSQAIHEYLVAATLRRFYTSVAMADLANIYIASEKAAADAMTGLLYRKMEPVYA